MKRTIAIAAVFALLAACATLPSGDAPSEVAALKAQVVTLTAENKLSRLKLADEMERADVQLYLTRQEIATAKREAAAIKAKCGAPCAP